MSNTPLVYCIILNLNGRASLFETLDTVRQMNYGNVKVVVVDNGSNDGSQEVVRQQYTWVTMIENGKNLGFGGGNNIAIQYALEHEAEWLLILNNDVVVAPDLLTQLMKIGVTDETIGILAPKIYYHSKPDTLWYAGGSVNYWMGIISHRGLREEDRGQYDHVGDTEYISGCAMLIRRKVLETVGMFDPVYYPAYSEDADLSTRAKRAGYRLVYVPSAKMWHKVSAFSGGGLTPLKTQLKVEHNLIYFKRYARWYHWLTIPWCVLSAAMVFVLREMLHGNFKIVGALAQGFVKAVRRVRS